MFSEIDIKMMQHSYKRDYKVLIPNEELLLSAKEFHKLKYHLSLSKISNLEEAIRESESFMKKNFYLHKVYQTTESDFFYFVLKNKNIKLEQFIEEYNNFGKLINPYSLPINTVEENFWFGFITELSVNEPVEELFTKTNLLFSRILISKNLTHFTPSIITHEITHSQLSSVRESIKSYYNSEVLSIFVDNLHQLENNKYTIEQEKILRFKEISNIVIGLHNQGHKQLQEEINSDYDKLYKFTMYVESVLKAYYLLDIYFNSNKSIQIDIKDFIQNIFDGKNTLEELLDIYNVNLEDSTKNFKKYVFQK